MASPFFDSAALSTQAHPCSCFLVGNLIPGLGPDFSPLLSSQGLQLPSNAVNTKAALMPYVCQAFPFS